MATIPGVNVFNMARSASPGAAGGEALPLPAWVHRLIGPPIRRKHVGGDGLSCSIAEAGGWSLASIVIPDAAELDALRLQHRTIDAYKLLQRALRESAAPFPLRFWNFIPDIHANLAENIDRYMSFNAGRFAAYCDWFGGPEAFDQQVATATGIGHAAAELVIHVLGGGEPGLHLHNPRQRRPYRYSRRYGPFPPCFARATVVRTAERGDGLVLVGGTASVLDEVSVHVNDLRGQVDETMHNLCRLLETASRAARVQRAPRDAAGLLRSFRSLRVYFARPEDEAWVRTAIARRMPHLTDIEFYSADICRADLLVEIEGTASL